MKKFIILFSIFLLVSCGEEPTEVQETRPQKTTTNTAEGRSGNIQTSTGSERSGNAQTSTGSERQGNQTQRPGQGGNELSIEVQSLGDFQNNFTIQKNGKVLPNQTIAVNPQVSGDVASVKVKEGDKVFAGQTLVSLKDSYSKYALDLEKTQIDYEKQVISKEAQIISIDKNISDLERNLNDAKRLYENAKLTAEEDTKSAEIAFQNSNTSDVNSSAYLALEKAELDYNNILNDNQQSIQGFITDAQKEYNNFYLNIVDIIEFGDKLFGVTSRNSDLADEIDTYFGVLNSSQKNDTKSLLLELISYQTYLETLDTDNISQDNILTFLNTYKDGYTKVTKFLNQLETTVNNSILSVGVLAQSDINSYVSQINSYQNSNQGDSSSYNSTFKSIDNFLANYKNDELLALKNLETTQKNYENSEDNSSISYNKTLINIDNTLSSSQKNYESILSAYNVAIEDKEITIRSLDNSIKSAKNTLTKAQIEYGKLHIVAPISGVISSLDTSVGEYVGTNTNLITIIGDTNTQIEVSLGENEVQNISLGDTVTIMYRNEEYTGKIFSIGSLANEALNYNVTVTFDDNISLVGGSATVMFQNNKISENISIPFNLVDVTGDDMGTINILQDGKLELLEVSLGKISGTNIEILNSIPSDTQVITTNLSTYNPNIQTLIVK